MHNICSRDGRHLSIIVRRRDLDDVRADDLEALERLEDLLDFLCPRERRVSTEWRTRRDGWV